MGPPRVLAEVGVQLALGPEVYEETLVDTALGDDSGDGPPPPPPALGT